MKGQPRSVLLLLEEVRQKLDLFPTLEFGGGGVRTLLACYPLLHQWPGLQRRIEALSISPEALRLLSSWGINPVGRVLALYPWRDLDDFILRLTTETIAEVLNDASVWNQMHLEWVLATARLVSRLCVLHGVDGTFRIADATFIHRAWQMSIHLTAVGSFGDDFFNARLAALSYLESIDPKITQRVNQNSLSLTIKRKKATSLEERYERMGLGRDVKERRKLLSLAVRYDEDYYLPSRDPVVSKQIMHAAAKARAYIQIEESPIPRPGGLGQVAFRRILATCRSTQTHASALVATMATAMLAPSQIMQADVQICDGFATISTRTNGSFTNLNGFDPALISGQTITSGGLCHFFWQIVFWKPAKFMVGKGVSSK